MIEPGVDVDRYVVEAQVGSGGHAVVWLVRHRTLGSLHAMKVLHLGSGAHAQRLLQEGRIQARLEHPNIVPVSDAFLTPGGIALLMPYVPGPSLATWLRDNRPSVEEARSILRGVLEGLGYAHRHGVIHRDLKPANILLASGPDGLVPRITDFGIARELDAGDDPALTESGAALGTVAYMAPEQGRSAHAVDARADLFSLGCILYELLTGKRSFPGPHLIDIVNASARGHFVPPRTLDPRVPADLDALVCACLQPDPADRPASCEAVRMRLGFEADVAPILEAPTWPPSLPAGVRPAPLVSWATRHRSALAAAVGLSLVVVVGAALLWRWPSTMAYPHRGGSLLHLDGKSAVLVPAAASLNLSGPMTIQAWVHPEAWNQGDFFPIVDRVWRLEITEHIVSFTAGKRTGSLLVYRVPLNRWTNIAIAYNPFLRSTSWYINGERVSTEPYSEPLWDFSKEEPMPLALGAGPYGRPEFAQGYLDDVRIWARELQPKEVLSSARGEPVDAADIVGEWRFDEGNGATTRDTSGNGNHGTLSGDVRWVSPEEVGGE